MHGTAFLSPQAMFIIETIHSFDFFVIRQYAMSHFISTQLSACFSKHNLTNLPNVARVAITFTPT